MSIASELSKLQENVSDIKSAIESKGGTVNGGLDNFAASILALSSGGKEVHIGNDTPTGDEVLWIDPTENAGPIKELTMSEYEAAKTAGTLETNIVYIITDYPVAIGEMLYDFTIVYDYPTTSAELDIIHDKYLEYGGVSSDWLTLRAGLLAGDTTIHSLHQASFIALTNAAQEYETTHEMVSFFLDSYVAVDNTISRSAVANVTENEKPILSVTPTAGVATLSKHHVSALGLVSSSIEIALPTSVETAAEYEFTLSTGATAPTLTFPVGIDLGSFSPKANKSYDCIIYNSKLYYYEW